MTETTVYETKNGETRKVEPDEKAKSAVKAADNKNKKKEDCKSDIPELEEN